MSCCVIDSSMALAWVLPDEGVAPTAILSDVLEHGGTAPALWLVEVANAIRSAERRKRITAAQRTTALQLLSGLPIALEPLGRERVLRDTMHIAATHGLTAYDACYLESALRLGLPLASLDHQLLEAANTCGLGVRSA